MSVRSFVSINESEKRDRDLSTKQKKDIRQRQVDLMKTGKMGFIALLIPPSLPLKHPNQ